MRFFVYCCHDHVDTNKHFDVTWVAVLLCCDGPDVLDGRPGHFGDLSPDEDGFAMLAFEPVPGLGDAGLE